MRAVRVPPWAGPAARALVSALLLYLIVRNLDAHQLRVLLGTARPEGLLAALLALMAAPMISAPRWQAILARLGWPLASGLLVRALYIGAFINQLLPSSVGGDVWRVWYCTRAGVPVGTATNSILIERFAGFAVMVLCFAVTFPWLDGRMIADPVRWLFWAFLAVCVGGILAVVALGWAAPHLGRIGLLRPVLGLAEALRTVGGTANLLGIMCATAVAGQLVAIVALFALAGSIGLQLSLFDCVVVLPPALLITLVPATLGGWGLREGAFVVILAFYGVAPEQALTLSILFGLVLMASTLPGLLLWAQRASPQPAATRVSGDR